MSEEHRILNFRKVFFEVCFLQKISPHDAVEYEKFLIKRRNNIETVVKNHFVLLHETLRALLRDALTKRRLQREKSWNLTFKDQRALEKKDDKIMAQHPMMKFYSPYYTIERKLKLLIQLEDQLIKADKERKENRKGTQEICRMVSTSQSYYMFDSSGYRVARGILYDFDRN